MRVGDVVLDSKGNPWFATIHLERYPRSVVLWHYNAKAWKSVDLLPHLQRVIPNRELVDATITFDNEDTLYAFCTVEKALARNVNWWGHPSQEVVLLTSKDKGVHFEVLQISELDPLKPNWLPSIERPFSGQSIGVPSLLFTHGGPGKGCTKGSATEVVFVRLGR